MMDLKPTEDVLDYLLILTDGSKYSEAEHETAAEGPDLMSRLPPGVSLPHPAHHSSLELLDDDRHLGPGDVGLQHIVGH